MNLTLLEFFNLGTGEIGVLLFIFLFPFILVVYSVFDIVKSDFKGRYTKLLMLALTILAPVMGSLIYLLIRKDYKVPGSGQGKMPI